MRKREMFSSATVERGAQPPLILSYYIVCSGHTYGVEIVMDCAGKRRRLRIADITASRERIVDFAQKLCKHHVTPCTLRDVVTDLLETV